LLSSIAERRRLDLPGKAEGTDVLGLTGGQHDRVPGISAVD
jgi:hypothetical protein